MKKKIEEKISKRRTRQSINRIWIERKESSNNTSFKVGTKYSYIVDIKKSTIKIIPFNENIKTRGTVSKKKDGEISIIDICNSTIEKAFKKYKQYKITIYENEIHVEGYKENNKVLNFLEKKKEIIKLPINQLDYLIENNNLNSRYNFLDDGFIYSTKGFDDYKVKEDLPILNKTIKLLSLFSGIGAFEKALKNIGQNFELTNYCEVENYIANSYSVIHNEPLSKNLGDINVVNVNELEDFDMMTLGFPCQDISALGKQLGLFDKYGNKTRSGLVINALQILKAKRPKIAIIENVKDLAYKKGAYCLDLIKRFLKEAGYNLYYKLLNTKDYNLPHSRRRFFGVCIRNDIDNYKFEFPEPMPLTKKASDYYDQLDIIPNECYVTEKQYAYFNEWRLKKGYSSLNSDVLICMTTKQGQRSNPQNFIHDSKGYRMLTPREMFALQGFDKEEADILLSRDVNMKQIGLMTGNSISVPVLECIFKKLIQTLPNVFGKLNTEFIYS